MIEDHEVSNNPKYLKFGLHRQFDDDIHERIQILRDSNIRLEDEVLRLKKVISELKEDRVLL